MLHCVLCLALAVALGSAAEAASLQGPPPPVEDYGRLPALEFVTLSPSGARYAFVVTAGDERRLAVSDTNGKILAVKTVGDLKVRGLSWAGDDHLLVDASATVDLDWRYRVARQELGAVIVLDLKHRRSFTVFGARGQRQLARAVAGEYGAAQVDGRWYGYFGGYRLGTGEVRLPSPDLYRVDLDSGDFTLAASGQGQAHGWLVGADGEVAARLLYDEASGAWRLMAGRSGGAEIAHGQEPTGEVAILGFGRSTDDILLRSGEADHDRIQALPLHGGPATGSLDSDHAGAPMFDPASRLWIGDAGDGEHQPARLFAADQETRLVSGVSAFPGALTRLVSYSTGLRRLIVFTSGQKDSGTYWLVDLDRRSAEAMGGEYPSVTAEAIGPVSWVNWRAADGLPMRGVLTLPPGRVAMNLPLVVMPHGGPEDHDRPRFDYWAQAFASRGYAVFQPNFRGSNGSGNAFRDAGFGQWGRKMQTDISDGVAELARQGIVDPKRACIVGWSYGGYAALAGVTLQHGLYRCAVAMAGVADLPAFLDYQRDANGAVSAATRFWKQYLGVGDGDQRALDDLSPPRLADRADAPILLIHGEDDTVVPIAQSRTMERALKHAGKPVKLITLPSADHWLLEEPARVAMLKASVEFVMKNNPPDPAPSAVAAK